MLEDLLQKLPWKEGRQETGYKKITFFSFWRVDSHLIYYPQGSEIPPHKDEVPEGKHYRFNLELIKPKEGGEFVSEKTIFDYGRMHLFRPDENEHSVSEITDGYRLVFSFGWLG